MLKDTIEQDLIHALKGKDAPKASALRLLKARIQQEEIAQGKKLEDAEVLSLIKSQVKRHKEAAEGFLKAERQEQYDEETSQGSILSAYLPVQLSSEDLENKLLAMVQTSGFSSKDFGVAIKQAKTELGDAADGSAIAEILKKILPAA